MKRPAAVFGLSLYAVLVLLRDCNVYAYAAAAIVSAAALAVILIIYLRKRRAAALLVALTAAAACCFACCAYLVKYAAVCAPAQKYLSSEETEISGVVTEVRQSSVGVRYTLRGENGLKITVISSSDLFLKPCDALTARVESIYRAGGDNDRPYYMSKGVYLGARVKEYISSEPDVSRNIFDRLARFRDGMCRRIIHTVGAQRGGLLAGIVFGDTYYLTQRISNAFRACGISHVFAVSGFHVTTWAAMVYFAVRLLRIRKQFSFILPALFVLAFTAVTGFPPSAMRAAIMAVILFSGGSFRLRADLLNSLGAALTAICAAEPFSGGSTSLLLSVCAMLGVILFSDYLYPAAEAGARRLLGRRAYVRVLLFFVSAMLLSITIIAVMLPVMLTAFGSVSVIAPLANLIVVPFAELAMPVGGVSALIGFAPGLRFAGAACEVMIRLTDRLAETFPLRAEFSLSVYLAVMAVCLAAFLLVKFVLKKAPPRGAFLLSGFLVCFCVSVFTSAAKFDKIQITAPRSDRIEALVEYRGFTALVCDGTPSAAALSTLDERGVYGLDFLCLASNGNARTLEKTFAPRFTAGPDDAGSADGGGMEIRFEPGLLVIEADGTTVLFDFDGEQASAELKPDVLFARKAPENTENAKYVVLPGKGGDHDNIYYTRNGFSYRSDRGTG